MDWKLSVVFFILQVWSLKKNMSISQTDMVINIEILKWWGYDCYLLTKTLF